MGQIQHILTENDEKLGFAAELCVKIGAIEECDFHDGEYIDLTGNADYMELTLEILEDDPDAINSFKNMEEMIESVKKVLDYAGEECHSCKNLKDS